MLSRHPSDWCLAIGLAGGLLFMGINMRNLIDSGDWQAVRADLRMVLGILVIVGACWRITDLRYRREAARRDGQVVWSSRVRAARDDTADLGPHLRVVGTAAVVAAPAPASESELSDYDKGYTDCLVDYPLDSRGAQVIPIDRHRH